MARIVYTPTDQAASASASCSGVSCNIDNNDTITNTGLPTRRAYDVRLKITCATTGDCDSSGSGTGAGGSGLIEYSTNNGSSWSTFVAGTCSAVCACTPISQTCTLAGGGTLVELNLGDLADISQIQVRARAVADTNSALDTGDGTSAITAWQVDVRSAIGIIGE